MDGHINKVDQSELFDLMHFYQGRNEYGIPFIDDDKVLSCRLVSALSWMDTYLGMYPQTKDSYHYGIYKGEKIDRQRLAEIIEAEIPGFNKRTRNELKRRIGVL
jgi:hypothetical protein